MMMIYNSHSCDVNGLRCSFPYRSGNILTVGGLWNLKQILAGFRTPAALAIPPSCFEWNPYCFSWSKSFSSKSSSSSNTPTLYNLICVMKFILSYTEQESVEKSCCCPQLGNPPKCIQCDVLVALVVPNHSIHPIVYAL